jgi:hypothetical protein
MKNDRRACATTYPHAGLVSTRSGGHYQHGSDLAYLSKKTAHSERSELYGDGDDASESYCD